MDLVGRHLALERRSCIEEVRLILVAQSFRLVHRREADGGPAGAQKIRCSLEIFFCIDVAAEGDEDRGHVE